MGREAVRGTLADLTLTSGGLGTAAARIIAVNANALAHWIKATLPLPARADAPRNETRLRARLSRIRAQFGVFNRMLGRA